MPDKKKNDKKKESGSKISNTEWGMAIFALLIVDLIEIGLDALFGIGAFINPFIDLLMNMAWPTYLYLRGVNLKSAKNLATLFIGGGLQQIPGFDGFWAIEGLVIMFITKAEEKIKEETGVDVGKIAAAAESGEVGAAAEETGAVGEAGGETAEGATETQDELDKLNTKKDLDHNDKLKLQQAELIMSGKGHRREQDEDDPVLKAAWEKYDRGIEAYDGIHEGGYQFAHVFQVGGMVPPSNQNQAPENTNENGETTKEGKKDDQKDKDKKKKPEERQGESGLFGGERPGSGPSGSRNKNRYRSPEEKAEDERLSFHSNLLDLSDPYAARKKKENEER